MGLVWLSCWHLAWLSRWRCCQGEVRRSVSIFFGVLMTCLLVIGKVRFYHTAKSFLISSSEDYALLVGNLSVLAFCCRVETGGKYGHGGGLCGLA